MTNLEMYIFWAKGANKAWAEHDLFSESVPHLLGHNWRKEAKEAMRLAGMWLDLARLREHNAEISLRL